MHEFDYEALKFWLAVLNTLGVIGVGIYSWWVNRDRITAQAIAAVRDDVDTLEDRVAACEHDVQERLKLHDLSELYDNLNRFNRELGEVSSKLSAVSAQLALHQQYLLTGGGVRP